MTHVAVFDLDNTLVQGSSLFHFARYLVGRRVISPRHVARFAVAQRRYAAGSGESEGSTSRAISVALGLVEGMPEETMGRLTAEFVARQRSRCLNPDVVREVRLQQAHGIPCFVATASPQELADAFARRLRMDGAFGTRTAVVDGVYTGRLAGPVCHGDTKAQRVRTGLALLGLDLSEATAYSDSINDLPLLVAARHPVAVHPDRDLAAIAGRHGWRVIARDRPNRHAVQGLLDHLPYPM